MKLRRACGYFLATVALSISGFPDKVTAQISSDGSLSTTVSTDDAVNFLIENGDRSGNNLFHSFREFSIPNFGSAYFNNATDITNIFSRVTGGSISEIQGLIRANGTANLFLINPAGIVFGENAALDVGGSFFASTAESVVFGDGIEFSATQPEEAPLLTINITPGLQMGENPGDIIVQGSGHNVTLAGLLFLQRGVDSAGLQVSLGNTISLVGGNIILNGGLLVADSGNVELAAFSSGEWRIGQSNSSPELIATSSTDLGNIQLLSSALVDTSGLIAGSTYLQGKQIEIQNGSAVISQNFGVLPGGSINVQASDQLSIIGSTLNLPSRLNTQTVGSGAAGDINVNSPNILLDSGGAIQTQTFSAAQSGNINVEALNLLQTIGLNLFIPSNQSGISNATFSSGNTGNITVSAGSIIIRDGSTAGGNFTFGTGNTGEIIINASEFIDVSGTSPVSASNITTLSFGEGNGGNVTINTPKLKVSNEGSLGSGTLASGNAGNVTINAFDVIELIGIGDREELSPLNNMINSAAVSNSASDFKALFGLPDEATGDGGDITINTSHLTITDNARISVATDSTGKAGTIILNANTVSLDNGASVSANTASGNGGEVTLTINDSLLLRNSSTIITEAGGTGNGGNININSELVTLLEASQINANAFEGNGGNITITTQGLFVAPNSSITASSQFGVDGTITLNTPDEENKLAIAELPANFTDASNQIVGNCSWTRDNTFYVVGRRGIAKTPQEHLEIYQMWSDIRDLSEFESATVIRESSPRQENTIVEANAMIINEDGKVELVAVVPNSNQNLGQVASSCSGKVDS